MQPQSTDTPTRISLKERIKRIEMTQKTIIILIFAGFALILLLAVLFQVLAEKNAFSLDSVSVHDSTANRNQFEVYKLAAEIRQIRSDTSGGLFWLKLVTLFVTVGGAVGGYLIGQDRVNKNKLNFEQRKNVYTAYQDIVKELASAEPVLRATAAVKLGAIIHHYPEEWNMSGDGEMNTVRRAELTALSKNVLAAMLSLEKNKKVLKTVTIALVTKSKTEPLPGETIADLTYLDFSRAEASDAFWAYVDFSNSDFFGAKLTNASLRSCRLYKTSFYKAELHKTVFRLADCRQGYFNYASLHGANFKDADLRGAYFSQAVIDEKTNFEGAKVSGAVFDDVNFDELKDVMVNIAPGDNDTPQNVSLKEWLSPPTV